MEVIRRVGVVARRHDHVLAAIASDVAHGDRVGLGGDRDRHVRLEEAVRGQDGPRSDGERHDPRDQQRRGSQPRAATSIHPSHPLSPPAADPIARPDRAYCTRPPGRSGGHPDAAVPARTTLPAGGTSLAFDMAGRVGRRLAPYHMRRSDPDG